MAYKLTLNMDSRELSDLLSRRPIFGGFRSLIGLNRWAILVP
jgi:hypothetical protein